MSATVNNSGRNRMMQPVRNLTVAPPADSAARALNLLRGFFDISAWAGTRRIALQPWGANHVRRID